MGRLDGKTAVVAGPAVGMKIDATDNADPKALVETAASRFGSLDIMANNASIFATLTPKPSFEIDDDEFDAIMRGLGDKNTQVNAIAPHPTATSSPARC